MKERKTFTEKVSISSKNGVKLEKQGSESRKDPKEMSQPGNTAEKKPSLEHNRLDGQHHTSAPGSAAAAAASVYNFSSIPRQNHPTAKPRLHACL